MLIEGVNSGMSDTNALKEELAEVLGELRRYKRPFPAMFGIAPGEFFTLGMIERYQDSSTGGVEASLIREVSQMSGPAVSQMLKALEKKDYIKRVMVEEDRRKVLVCLTQQGKEILTTSKKMFLAIVDKIYEDFGEKDTRKFIELLNRFQVIFYEGTSCDKI